MEKSRPEKTIDIDELIEILKKEKEKGATKITLAGESTLLSDRGNSVIFTTEPQM